MEENKLELKHLAPYLPYGLKIKGYPYAGYPNKDKEHSANGTITGLRHDWVDVRFYDIYGKDWDNDTRVGFKDIQPYLHPISDLDRRIWHNGERINVGEIVIPHEEYKNDFYRQCAIEEVTNASAIEFSCIYFSIVQTLIEYHFDIYGLIESGLALPIPQQFNKQ